MSKIKIAGNASGSGTLTIQAPDTSSSRTITLPDETATLSTFDPDGAVTINDSGADVDFRVESDTDANALFVQGSDSSIGIGTNNPSTKLEIYSAEDEGSYLTLRDGQNDALHVVGEDIGGILFYSDDASASLAGVRASIRYTWQNTSGSDAAMIFSTADTSTNKDVERMRITSTGMVDWTIPSSGTIAEWGTFSGSGATKGRVILQNSNSIYERYSAESSSTSYFLEFYNTNGGCGDISVSGSSTNYNTSSDYRLKEDVKPMSASIDKLKELKPVNFAWKVDGSRVDGFLAHEAQEVVPEAISGEKDAMTTEEYEVEPAIEATYDEEGNELTPAVEAVMGEREVIKPQGIDQSKLVPLLTSALQEAVAKIEELTTRIEILEAN